MTNTLAVKRKPVWTNPANLKDNTIVSASYWNQVTSNVGSMQWLRNKTIARASCNIAVAEWTQSIPVKSSSATNSTIIKFSNISNGNYFKANGSIILPSNTPCLIIWKVWYYGETVRTGYSQRTRLIKRYLTNKGKTPVFQTVASFFNRKYDGSQVVVNAAYAVVSNVASDVYYIGVDHGFHTAINTRGTCHIIFNPGMV
jgi:hypothetical protein